MHLRLGEPELQCQGPFSSVFFFSLLRPDLFFFFWEVGSLDQESTWKAFRVVSEFQNVFCYIVLWQESLSGDVTADCCFKFWVGARTFQPEK